jgi:putative salt-induced outer membrane protein YdiY
MLAATNSWAKTPTPEFEGDWDWLQLTSKEWLKGDFIAMYKDVLEFDSDKLGSLEIDWEDVAELHTKGPQSVRISDNRIITGLITYKDEQLEITAAGLTTTITNDQLVSLAPAQGNRKGYWSAKVTLGLDTQSGNTTQYSKTVTATIQRRTASSRIQLDYNLNYSDSTNSDTGEETVTADSVRFKAIADYYLNQNWFVRFADYEYFVDPFQNIEKRTTWGVKAGYTAINTSTVDLEFSAGPGYQATEFVTVQAGASTEDESKVLQFESSWSWEFINDFTYLLKYNYTDVNDSLGDSLTHVETGFEIEPIDDFTINFTYYLDRTEKPVPAEDGSIPERDDKRFVISVGLDF